MHLFKMFASKRPTSLTDYYTSAIKKGLMGKWSQKIDPSLPYYQPSFVLLQQPVTHLSAHGRNVANSQVSVAVSSKNQESGFHLVWKILINWLVFLLLSVAVLVALIYLGPRLNYALSTSLESSNSKNLSNLFGLIPTQEADQYWKTSKLREEYDQYLNQDELNQQLEPEEVETVEEEIRYLPEFDPSLPEGDLLIIDKIGVNTQLQRTETESEALDTGAWWVPDFGIPGDLKMPMIVSAHRYGWEWWWKSDYWQLHSFYKLPHLQPGDRVEIISEQRRFIYEIYDGEEGEQISDYDADLILYTCKHLNSPIRYFRYARLVRDN